MRRVVGLLSAAVLALSLNACATAPALDTGSGGQIEVAALVVCDSPEVQALQQAHAPKYAVSFWHRHKASPFPACPVKVEVALIPAYGQPSVWVARDVGEASVHMISRNLITPKALLCIRVYGNKGLRVTNDPNAEHQLLKTGEHRWETCDPAGELYQSVRAGKSTGKPGDGWRKVTIVNGASK